jgi:hypothetical protein
MSALVTATVKYPSREVTTRFGKKINVVLVDSNGNEITQWANPNNEELKSLKKNQQVTLVKGKDNKYSLLYNDSLGDDTKPTVSSKTEQGWNDELKRKLFNEAKQYISFYNYCLGEVQQQITTLKEEESIRTVATTIFIQSIRANI